MSNFCNNKMIKQELEEKKNIFDSTYFTTGFPIKTSDLKLIFNSSLPSLASLSRESLDFFQTFEIL